MAKSKSLQGATKQDAERAEHPSASCRTADCKPAAQPSCRQGGRSSDHQIRSPASSGSARSLYCRTDRRSPRIIEKLGKIQCVFFRQISLISYCDLRRIEYKRCFQSDFSLYLSENPVCANIDIFKKILLRRKNTRRSF